MNPTNAQVLADLRDIHTPDAISMWPLALGWYLLAGLILLLLVGIYSYYRYWRKHKYYRKQALKHLNRIYREQDQAAFLHAVAELIKHTALQHDQGVAKLNGEQWQQYLAQAMPTDVAKILAVARYQQQLVFDKTAIYQATQQWIKVH